MHWRWRDPGNVTREPQNQLTNMWNPLIRESCCHRAGFLGSTVAPFLAKIFRFGMILLGRLPWFRWREITYPERVGRGLTKGCLQSSMHERIRSMYLANHVMIHQRAQLRGRLDRWDSSHQLRKTICISAPFASTKSHHESWCSTSAPPFLIPWSLTFEAETICMLHSLKLTANAPKNRQTCPKRKRSSSNPHFSGANRWVQGT